MKPNSTNQKQAETFREAGALTEEHFREMVEAYAEECSRLDNADELDRPTYGCTIYLAKTQVETLFGEFTAYIFQDIIHKGYIVALAYGEILDAKTLHTRVHSSCVTSETLRGCDCDCVQQLEGAIRKIASEGAGVLFYLLQEGRGVGYVAKARDRMLVQSTQDNISTFEAYMHLGLRKDYRQYRNVSDICHILGIKASWILLTNNPDKLEAMRKNGLEVVRTDKLEFEPEPYNLAYLHSKMESGHFLERPRISGVVRMQTPEPVVPIRPRALQAGQRFIYMARYFLPVRPVDGQVVLEIEQLQKIAGGESIEAYLAKHKEYLTDCRFLRNNRALVQVNDAALKQLRDVDPDNPIMEFLTLPYWFQAHVYFDLVSGTDYVVLTYGKPAIYDIPVVRVHSESILNRFPVTDLDNKKKYCRSLLEIVRYGIGAIVLSYHDGRGAGFGAHAIDRMMKEQGTSFSSTESYRQLGVGYDQRDYDGLMTVLKEHLPGNKIQMIMNSPNSLVGKPEFSESLKRTKLDIVHWIFLEEMDD
jgi:3,4-dihydroxy 2-butanone 4-phosphate synthase/GTP cyclohydrolase II